MIENLWVSLDKAAEFVDLSKPTILRRAVYFDKHVDEIDSTLSLGIGSYLVELAAHVADGPRQHTTAK